MLCELRIEFGTVEHVKFYQIAQMPLLREMRDWLMQHYQTDLVIGATYYVLLFPDLETQTEFVLTWLN